MASSSSNADAAQAEIERATGERGGWEGSSIPWEDVETLRASRKIPMEVSCRIPLGEIAPHPEKGEFVVFGAHFDRGFALPASDFFREFLNRFQLQPHHLPANAIVALSSFTTFCEAYLGLHPTVDLWAKFFSLRPGVVQGLELPDGTPKPLSVCGSALIIPRRDSIFPRVTCIDTVKKWQKTFFYVRNPDDGADYINLPAYSAATPPAAPEERAYWKLEADDEDPEVALVVSRLQNMIAGGLTAADLVLTFLSRRVSPLQRRLHKMCYMSGAQDACRHSTFELSKAAVQRRLKLLIKSSIKPEWEFGLAPFSRDNHIPNVSFSGILYHIPSFHFPAY